jgi:hypothetical protein
MSFTVDPDALEAFSRSALKHAETIGVLLAQLDGAKIGRDSFGHIPWVGSAIYDAYDEHVDACRSSIEATRDGIDSISAGVALSALGFLSSDKSASEIFVGGH